MSVSGINSSPRALEIAGGLPSTTRTTASSDDFLKLLTTQLRYQNPLDPVNDSQFVSQLSQISTVEGIQKLNSNMSELLLMQSLSQGANLIGKKISYDSDGKGTLVQGTVQSVQVNAGRVSLQVSGKAVNMSQIRGLTG